MCAPRLQVYEAIDAAVASHTTRVSTAVLNDVIRDALRWQPPPMMHGGQVSSVSRAHAYTFLHLFR